MSTVDLGLEQPVATVVVFAFRGAAVIRRALGSLARQECSEPFEIVVVWSGEDETPELVQREFPTVRLVGRRDRLPTGAARNLGIAQARGQIIAFLEADCEAAPDWLARRLHAHREGFAGVGGAVLCAAPAGPVARASHLLEYAACSPGRPRGVVLDEPVYALSFRRDVFERHGIYPPGQEAAEDVLFNRHLVRAGERLLFDPAIRIVHPAHDGLREFVRHQAWHGWWFGRLCRVHGYPALRGVAHWGRWRLTAAYPVWRAARLAERIVRWQRTALGDLVLLSPLILLGILAATVGLVRGWSASEPTT